MPTSLDEGHPENCLVVYAASPDEMKRIGAVLATLLRPADTVLLGGELGVGDPVTSPTFVLVHSYKTNVGWDLLHADVWRLEHLHEVIDLALPELLEEGAAAVIEWGEMAAPALAPDWLQVSISYDAAGPGSEPAASGRRRLVFRATGASWAGRMADLSEMLGNLGQTGDEPGRLGPGRRGPAQRGPDR
jgi:tRNA threonylcarbamoyladenosine biosynthesis protein TsaE